MNEGALQMRVGTLPWARETLGALRGRDRLVLAGQAFRLQGILASSLLFRRNTIGLDLAAIHPPDSPVAQKASALCATVSPPMLFNHCCRAYLWGRAFAHALGVRFDDELLYAACMLHDLGLTVAYGDCGRHAECFTLDSVEGASAWSKDVGWDAARQDALAEAILLHMNVVVDVEQGVEAHLLHEAACLDCLGLRAWELTHKTRNTVIARHPRGPFKSYLVDTFSAQARRRPGCRAAFLIRYLLFRPMIRSAPFDEQ